MVNENYKKKFLKYISFDTKSDEDSLSCPSTSKQLLLGKQLVEELHAMGLDNAYIDENGYVYAFVKSNCNSNETIGLIAHMDTSPDASGKDVKPQIIPNYDGSILKVNEKLGIILDPEVFPALKGQIGHELITTDGTTLLGADDKSGVAIIMTTVEELLNSNEEYPNIIITFTPDEEIGRGADLVNLDFYKEHNCYRAYTIDGGSADIIEFENFNAASATVIINGKSIHPGSAKNKLINSQLLAMEFHSLLPVAMRPELTSGYEGFNHLTEIHGQCEKTEMRYIIRNHDMKIFEEQKKMFCDIMDYMNKKYGLGTVELILKDSYYNMKEIVEQHPEVIELAKEAYIESGITPKFEPIRGGTDGARLSFMGIVTPNLGTGGQNYHGPFEYVDVDEASLMVKLIKKVLSKYC